MKKTNATLTPRSGSPGYSSIFGLIALAALPASIIPAAAQQSSADVRNMTVVQRPREAFDAKGIPVGSGLRFFPSLDLTESYTDNLYATHTNTVDDLQSTISPKLLLKSDWSRHSLSLMVHGDIHRYLDQSTEDNEEYGAEAGVGFDLARGSSLGLQANYDHVTVGRGDPEARQRDNADPTRRLTPEKVDVTHGRATWTQEFSRLLIGARADYLDWNETDFRDRDRDHKEYTGAFQVGYVVSPALRVFIEPNYTRRDFDLAFDSNGINRDSEVKGINAGISYDITGLLYGETRIGWYRAGFADPRTKSDSGLSIDSKTTWNLTARDSLIFVASRRNVVTNDPTSSSRILTGGSLEYQHELTRNIILRGRFSYESNEFVNSIPKRDEDSISGMVRGDYLINRYLSVYLSYTYTDVDSTLSFDSFKESVILIGIQTHI